MSNYVLTLRDKDKLDIASTRLVADPSYERKLNSASSFSFSVAGDSEFSSLAQLSNHVRLERGGRRVITGVITGRELGSSLAIKGFTEEYLMRDIRLPVNWGNKFHSLELGAGIRHLLEGGYWELNYKLQSQWDNAHQLVDVETSTANNGCVQLKKNSSLHYLSSGYVVVVFDSQDVLDFKHWQSVRWKSTYEADVATGVQVDFAHNLASVGLGWTPTTSASYGEGNVNSVLGLAGYLTDSIGIDVGKRTERFMAVRVNLSSSDTTTPNDEDSPTAYGFTPLVQNVQGIARTYEYPYLEEQIGGFPDTSGFLIGNVSLSDVNGLEAVQRIFENVNNRFGSSWEFLADEGRLHIGNPLGNDLTNEVLLNTGRG